MTDKKHWLQGAVNPKKAGMFDNVPTEHIRHELRRLHEAGPYPKGSAKLTRVHELLFALRARSKQGFHSK